MTKYYVDVRFEVEAEDAPDAAYKVHEFIPDVDGDIIQWIMADSLIVPSIDSDTKRIVNNEERCEICAHFDKVCTVTQEGSGVIAVSPMDWCEKFTPSQEKHSVRTAKK